MNKTTKKVFDYIVAYKLAHDGIAPTVREIVSNVAGVSSTSHSQYCLEKLEKEGLIEAGGGKKPRYIKVLGGLWSYNPDLARCLGEENRQSPE